MTMVDPIPWLTLALLGAFHGLNPAMGWLFAVALGLQERNRAAVLRAFGPIALGHAASVAAVVVLALATQVVIDERTLRILGAMALMALGVYKLLAPMSHPRWVGMRVNGRDLTTWSFLMATAHGAGLMLVPVLLSLRAAPAGHAHAHADHVMQMSAPVGSISTELAAVGVHTAAMYLVMGAIALVVFERLGVAIVRRAWFNFDRLWAAALVGAGAITLVI
jgi:hypothetical protein